jgi:GNAT superfamily N-acetyltransferase
MLLNNPQTRYEEFYKIYEQSFPSIERRTKEGQKAVLEDADYRVRVVEEDGKILAFLGYWELPHCLFLEHLATTKASRGKGHGKKLVQECLKDTKKPVFLEIEPIIEEDPMTGRRAGFYERLGFHANPFIYEQMPLKPEDKPMELWIMSYGSTISEEDFLPYKKEIYHSVYKKEI